MRSAGAPPSRMVPSPDAPSRAFCASSSVRVRTSSPSSRASCSRVTATDFAVSPAAKVSVPDAGPVVASRGRGHVHGLVVHRHRAFRPGVQTHGEDHLATGFGRGRVPGRDDRGHVVVADRAGRRRCRKGRVLGAAQRESERLQVRLVHRVVGDRHADHTANLPGRRSAPRRPRRRSRVPAPRCRRRCGSARLTSLPLAADSVRSKSTVPSLSAAVAPSTLSMGRSSSSVIRPTPRASPSTAFTGAPETQREALARLRRVVVDDGHIDGPAGLPGREGQHAVRPGEVGAGLGGAALGLVAHRHLAGARGVEGHREGDLRVRLRRRRIAHRERRRRRLHRAARDLHFHRDRFDDGVVAAGGLVGDLDGPAVRIVGRGDGHRLRRVPVPRREGERGWRQGDRAGIRGRHGGGDRHVRGGLRGERHGVAPLGAGREIESGRVHHEPAPVVVHDRQPGRVRGARRSRRIRCWARASPRSDSPGTVRVPPRRRRRE